MTELEGIVQQYAGTLLKKASNAVLTFSVGGALMGGVLGSIPRLFSHTLISPSVSYFAVLLGAIAGGYVGRTIGQRRAGALRFQAQMALRQFQIETRSAAPVARPPAPALPPPAVPPLAAPP